MFWQTKPKQPSDEMAVLLRGAEIRQNIYERANQTMADMQRPYLEMRRKRMEAAQLGWRLPK